MRWLSSLQSGAVWSSCTSFGSFGSECIDSKLLFILAGCSTKPQKEVNESIWGEVGVGGQTDEWLAGVGAMQRQGSWEMGCLGWRLSVTRVCSGSEISQFMTFFSTNIRTVQQLLEDLV